MADGPALKLQKALVRALRGSEEVAAIVGDRVYDQPPDGAALPYVRIGGIEPRPVRATTSRAVGLTYSVEAHSRPHGSGRVQATQITEAVRAVLDEQEGTLTAPGFDVVENSWITTTVARASDGETYTGIIAFSALVNG